MNRLAARFPALYRLAALWGLLAMLVPVATTLVHHADAASVFVHICGLDHTGGDAPDKSPAHKLPSCPICQSLHLLGGALVPPTSPALAVPAPVVILLSRARIPGIAGFAVIPQARPRAPPVFA